jgi:AraC-like DNA-binding protein
MIEPDHPASRAPPPRPPGAPRSPEPLQSPLQSVVFSTRGVDPRHRFDLWRSRYESFNALSLTEAAPAEFHGHNEIWTFGTMALMRNVAPSMLFERSPRHARRDAVDHWVIRVARSGRSRLRIGEADLRLEPGQAALFTLGLPHKGERSEADWLSLYIPRDSVPLLSAGLGRLGNRVLDWPGVRLLVEYLLMLERRMPCVTPDEVPAMVEATRAMVAACLLTGGETGQDAQRDQAVTRLERIRCVLRAHIASPTLGPEKLCRLAGLSRSQLYQLFEVHGGVARYIQSQRMRLAHAMLSDPDNRLPIAAIAERVGHFDAAAFSRAFRREYGYTPREARRLFLPEPAQAVPESTVPEGADFAGILRHLGAAAGTLPHGRPRAGHGQEGAPSA